VSAIAEQLPEAEEQAHELAPAPWIELPPVEALPGAVQAAAIDYAADPGPETLAQLIAAVDAVGHQLEHAIAGRALAARAALVEACARVAELHDELVTLHSTARWLQGFPLRARWEPEPYALAVAGRQALDVPELLGAIEDACAVDRRLCGIGRRALPGEDPYLAPAPVGSGRRAPPLAALGEAGVTLNDVAELMPGGASTSSVSRWLSGQRPVPAELPPVLERLVGAGEAARILALIPVRSDNP
jgi:hypothetical protein